MEAIIKQIKTDLKPLKKDLGLRLKRTNNQKQEILEYIKVFGLNQNKHNLTLKISLQKAEKSISLNYSYICMKKHCELDETFSFFNDQTKEYPGLPDEDVKRIKELYQFDVIEGVIQNQVPLETQAEVLVKVVNKNWADIVDFVKNQNTPE